MDKDKLIDAINIALNEADDFVMRYYAGDEKPMIDTKKVLILLCQEVENNPDKINERVLRAMRDIGAIAVKSYENTPLDDAIYNVGSILYDTLPRYKNLQPLRMDFGKGNPI